ncbi:hypothetical protein PR202_ga13947 [Eleusine coracana subsp. coracana]|uniref:Trichome birefringence-like N-terminal domain-containing protein n=1 Tax=Eleusine coracana subsp. coracana TaxID=191504 RepID=A0AAV5CG91_ELECO|nr:hypothetical protein PR202_ga13947 [Eleusine coracana subsp. coracana]
MTTGSTPPRKARGGVGGGDDVEDAWLAAEAAKRSHARAAVWGVRLRGHFNTFLLLLLAVLAFLAVSVGTRSGNNAGTTPPQPPSSTLSVMSDKGNITDQPRAPVSGSTQKVSGVAPEATTTPLLITAKKGHVVETPKALPVSTIKKTNAVEPRAPMTVPSLSSDDDDDSGDQQQQQAECDMSSGRWVYDDKAYPLYKESSCKFMSDQAACHKFGRTDLRYQHWRWQPHRCDLPRFDAFKLLRKLRNKRLAFVGDSLNRNQWVSMVCLIDTATPTLHKYMSGNGSLVSFKIPEYNASVEFYWSPLLVESNSDHPVHHRIADRVVRAGSIAKHARTWNDADVLVFNSYLWWRRPTMKILWTSFQEAAQQSRSVSYEVTDSLRAFELSMATWSQWLERHVDRARTRLFFMSMSPTHFHSDEWGGGGGGPPNHQCFNETEPIPGEARRGRDTDPAFASAVDAQDAHPSVHRRQWDPPTEEQKRGARAREPGSDADCIHWCLPGVPDVWNLMLYAHIVLPS